jgi:tetratricopeptide (TPR) repeat protein
VKELSRRQSITRNGSILVLLLVLILAPRPCAGYLDLLQARRLETAGDYAAAGNRYAMAAERLPWQPSLWEQAGISARLDGDAAYALLYLKRAAGHKAISQAGWLSLGIAYRQSGDLQSAMDAWQKALPLTEAYRYLAQSQRELGLFQQAIQNWRLSLALDPQDAAAHFQLGLLEMAAAPKDALDDLLEAARLDPALDAPVQSLRSALNTAYLQDDAAYQLVVSGRALGACGNWDLAAEAFRNAVTAQADYADAWGWLGEAEQQLGQDGSSEMAQALRLDPNSAMLQSLYGIYLQRQKQPQAALAAFQKAADLEPENPGWQMGLGGAYEQAGDLVAALTHYQKATELAPADAAAWRALAAFCLRNNVDLQGIGLPAARKLVDLAGSDWEADDIAGQMQLETGNLNGAAALFFKAIELDPSQAAPFLHLGILYLQANNPAAAQSNLSQAKSLDPGGPYGWQAGRLLEQYFP